MHQCENNVTRYLGITTAVCLRVYALRCIKDWISTVLVLTWVACNISGKENAMGIRCDIP